jgi:hypothetical protein
MCDLSKSARLVAQIYGCVLGKTIFGVTGYLGRYVVAEFKGQGCLTQRSRLTHINGVPGRMR